MAAKISESRFFMWRTLFAVAHADAVVTNEEIIFMNKILDAQSFTEAQREILKYDMEQKQDIRILFSKITDQQDRSEFFNLARPLVWADGDFGSDEQKIILELNRQHQKSVDYETFETSKDMKLDDEEYHPVSRESRQDDSLLKKVLKMLAGV